MWHATLLRHAWLRAALCIWWVDDDDDDDDATYTCGRDPWYSCQWWLPDGNRHLSPGHGFVAAESAGARSVGSTAEPLLPGHVCDASWPAMPQVQRVNSDVWALVG
jgi:hypothetical protein